MGAVRFAKAMAMVALFNGALYLCVREEVLAGEKAEEAKKYTEQLRKGKDAKAKITALQELGALGQIKKSFITDALPDIYKAVEDKDPGVRAAAAEALGKADEPYEKVGDVLVKVLKQDKEDSVKIGALKGLSAMRDSAKGALPAIRDIIKNADKKSNLAKAAIAANKAIGGTGKKN
jgi:HEAT repeat protein